MRQKISGYGISKHGKILGGTWKGREVIPFPIPAGMSDEAAMLAVHDEIVAQERQRREEDERERVRARAQERAENLAEARMIRDDPDTHCAISDQDGYRVYRIEYVQQSVSSGRWSLMLVNGIYANSRISYTRLSTGRGWGWHHNDVEVGTMLMDQEFDQYIVWRLIADDFEPEG